MRFGKTCCVIAAGFLVPLVAGCSHCCHRPACPPPPRGQVLVPGPAVPLPPPPAFPGAAVQPVPPPAPAPFPVPPQQRNFEPPVAVPQAQGWQPADSNVRLAPPDPTAAAPPAESTRLLPPEPPAPVPAPPAAPRVAEQRPPAPSLPVGIPQFALARDRVAAGLRPMLDDGLDWLQANGYRTVLHVKRAGEDDDADRRQVEKRGMRYLSLEASPQTLGRQVVEDFNRTVNDAAGYPLFVYDRDGALAGGLWYLYYRTAEHAGDDAARVRAGALGLREDRDEAHREMWLAVQRFLGDQLR